jgi:hypothetical protein
MIGTPLQDRRQQQGTPVPTTHRPLPEATGGHLQGTTLHANERRLHSGGTVSHHGEAEAERRTFVTGANLV